MQIVTTLKLYTFLVLKKTSVYHNFHFTVLLNIEQETDVELNSTCKNYEFPSELC